MADELTMLREFFDSYIGLEHAFEADAVHRSIARFNTAKRALLQAADSKEAESVHVIGAAGVNADGGKSNG